MLLFNYTCHDKNLFSLTCSRNRVIKHAECREKDVPNIRPWARQEEMKRRRKREREEDKDEEDEEWSEEEEPQSETSATGGSQWWPPHRMHRNIHTFTGLSEAWPIMSNAAGLHRSYPAVGRIDKPVLPTMCGLVRLRANLGSSLPPPFLTDNVRHIPAHDHKDGTLHKRWSEEVTVYTRTIPCIALQ